MVNVCGWFEGEWREICNVVSVIKGYWKVNYERESKKCVRDVGIVKGISVVGGFLIFIGLGWDFRKGFVCFIWWNVGVDIDFIWL